MLSQNNEKSLLKFVPPAERFHKTSFQSPPPKSRKLQTRQPQGRASQPTKARNSPRFPRPGIPGTPPSIRLRGGAIRRRLVKASRRRTNSARRRTSASALKAFRGKWTGRFFGLATKAQPRKSRRTRFFLAAFAPPPPSQRPARLRGCLLEFGLADGAFVSARGAAQSHLAGLRSKSDLGCFGGGRRCWHRQTEWQSLERFLEERSWDEHLFAQKLDMYW